MPLAAIAHGAVCRVRAISALLGVGLLAACSSPAISTPGTTSATISTATASNPTTSSPALTQQTQTQTQTQAHRPGVIGLTVDGDGVNEADGRAVSIDATGRIVTDMSFASKGRSQMVRRGSRVLVTGQDGLRALGADGSAVIKAPLDQTPTHLFDVGGRAVTILNVGFLKPGEYTYRFVVAQAGHTPRTIDLKRMIMSVSQCGDHLLVVSTIPARNHELEPHVADLFDPETLTFRRIARWTPGSPMRDSYSSYGACAGGVARNVTMNDALPGQEASNVAVGGQGEVAKGLTLTSISTSGKRTDTPLVSVKGARLPGHEVSGMRGTAIVQRSLYWIAGDKDLTEHLLFVTNVDTGVTRQVVRLDNSGMEPREQVNAIDGASVISMDWSATEKCVVVTVRRLSDGRVTFGPTHIPELNAPSLGNATPIDAAVIDDAVRSDLFSS